MNSHSIKLTGKFEISEPLEIDHSYNTEIKLSINGISKHSLENGEYEFVYHAQPEFGGIEKENGERLKLQDKKKQSVKLRQQLGFLAQERGLDPEKFYEEVMIKLRHHTLEVLDFLEGLNNV